MRICFNEDDLEKEQVLAKFVKDVPGGCVVECSCGNHMIDNSLVDEPLICDHCPKEMFYGAWYEW